MISKKCTQGIKKVPSIPKELEDTQGLTYEQYLSLRNNLRDDTLFWKVEKLAVDTDNYFVKKVIRVKQINLTIELSRRLNVNKIIEIAKDQNLYDEFIASHSKKYPIEPVPLTRQDDVDLKVELTVKREQLLKGNFSHGWQQQLVDKQYPPHPRPKMSNSFFTQKPQKSDAENKIDSDYYNFITQIEGFKYLKTSPLWEKAKLDDDIKQAFYEFQKMRLSFKDGFDINGELPPGNYACLNEVFFAPVRLPGLSAPPPQGWKIHITAHPHSAQKIAALILSQIDSHIELAGNDGKEVPAKHTFYKIVHQIELMRTLYYIYGNLKGEGRETQAGKFITIYPSNRKHAAALAQTLDNILLWAIKGGILTKNDFYPCAGDALVGESGGIYVRYGNLTRHQNQVLTTKYNKVSRILPNSIVRHNIDSCISLATNVKAIQDDRRYPWPDFMNKNDVSWKDAKDPFPGLNLRWSFNPDMPPITWENRPDSWSDLHACCNNTQMSPSLPTTI